MAKRTLTLPFTGLAAAALLATALAPAANAAAHDPSHGPSHGASHAGHGAAPASADGAAQTSTSAGTTPVYFAARLSGREEVPVRGGPAVGDKDGGAYAVVRISGDRVSYAVRWKGIEVPTAFHIHQGKAGTNGDVKIGFFAEALPGSASAVAGRLTVGDRGLLARITKNPGNWYLNLHTGEFPGGAVRAQLHRLPRGADLAALLADGTRASFGVRADGRQEVPAPPKRTGDRDGRAEWLFGLRGSKIYYATVWDRVDPVTNGHVHRGKKGRNGEVVADLFADADGLPASVYGIAGAAPVKAEIADGIRRNPKNWYANLHTTVFDGGAVRGQLLRTRHGSW
ncbi:hypothetical protein Ssi03_31210 [Sphaerisporangium siamense]|uniref:CHRD domain-containing protein n=1 Tax=Sphaerisporangium siamense TaxID=795645 RepID=A0A7W7DCB7_9ACTN|nr:CHRD domain-containing protein [Sphaerisporangium siamense]MBB4704187.1 hypothetical protein [Sphaerisporangium siamense]GII85131.1 hypothetical protein Ssi03_31210 [Sphaerisporangium siamense]